MSNEEEGAQTPPAPESESPDPQTHQEPEEGIDEDGSESRRPRLLPVWVLLGGAALAGGAWAVTEFVGRGPAPDEAQVPLITASAESWKVRPDDPGGMEIPNQGTLIYETLTTADPEEAPERILPSPEEPLSPPRPAAEDADRTAEAAPDATSDAVAPPAADALESAPAEGTPPTEALGTPELAAVEPAPPAEPAWVEETRPPEPDPVEATAVFDLEALEGGSIVLPPPPKPRPSDLLLAEAAPAPETEAFASETEAPSSSARPLEASPVPLPVDKPVRVVRAERPSEAITATPLREEAAPSSTIRIWRYVQLGTASSRAPLESHWEMLRRNHEDAIVGLSPLIMPVDRGDAGIFYRLRAGPLSDEETARWVCAQLRARGLECFVPRD